MAVHIVMIGLPRPLHLVDRLDNMVVDRVEIVPVADPVSGDGASNKQNATAPASNVFFMNNLSIKLD